MEFMPQHAPFVALSFLGTGLLCFVAGVVVVYALVVGKHALAKLAAVVAVTVGGGYLAILLSFSFFSSEKVLRAGQMKYFCEVDCHLAYSVMDVSTAETLGSGVRQATASGTFYVVTLRTWFDERTTSVGRGNGPLLPNARWLFVIDDRGRRFNTSLEGMEAIGNGATMGRGSVPLTQSLRPGDSYQTTLVFDLPSGAGIPLLYLGERHLVTLLIIGHENSPFHKKIFFALEPQDRI
ncbi:MAG: hypothetical protein ACE5HV_02750 [Acidobacteriota bacterium]